MTFPKKEGSCCCQRAGDPVSTSNGSVRSAGIVSPQPKTGVPIEPLPVRCRVVPRRDVPEQAYAPFGVIGNVPRLGELHYFCARRQIQGDRVGPPDDAYLSSSGRSVLLSSKGTYIILQKLRPAVS